MTAAHPAAHLGGDVVGDAALLHLAGERRVEPGEHRVGAVLRAAAQHHLEARPAATSATPAPMIPEPTTPMRLTAIAHVPLWVPVWESEQVTSR